MEGPGAVQWDSSQMALLTEGKINCVCASCVCLLVFVCLRVCTTGSTYLLCLGSASPVKYDTLTPGLLSCDIVYNFRAQPTKQISGLPNRSRGVVETTDPNS